MNLIWLRLGVFALSTLPAVKLVLDAVGAAGWSLGANPIESLLHRAGWWGLTFLLITLSVTPLRDITGLSALIRIRRMVGLFAFFYLSLHLLTYAVLDQRLALGPIIEDIFKRPYITIGIIAFVLLVPLALTSNKASQRKLKKRWKMLHRLTYPIAILGVWHFWWQVKKDITEPFIFAAILAVLLGYRLAKYRQRRKRSHDA